MFLTDGMLFNTCAEVTTLVHKEDIKACCTTSYHELSTAKFSRHLQKEKM